MQLTDLVAHFSARATELEAFAPPAAAAFREAAHELEAALRDVDEESLTLEQAASISGYSTDHLSRLVRERRVPNAGTKGKPRIRRADLPSKPARPTLRALA